MAPLLLLIASLLALVAAEIVTLRPTLAQSHDLIERRNPNSRTQRQYQPAPPTHLPDGDADLLEDLELLDIVLLASVDGKFHALNRTSGHTLWSMASYSTASNAAAPSALSPLVGTKHIDYDPEVTDENASQEVYIIEPQSGDIYIAANPSSPLQRFPFSMQELVDMSPYSFSGDEGRRVFVGKKVTSLLVVELETGKVKATLNSECPWDQFEDFKDDYAELDLDELDGSKPQKAPPTEVYIGRTDYHVSIFTGPLDRHAPRARQQIQNLSFSIYGPNKQDAHTQSIYRHTKDNAYIQSLPDGEILSFKAKSSMDSVETPNILPLWGQNFKQPVVAVFDVLRRKSDGPRGPHPFVLLQPRPKIQDLIPNLAATLKRNPLTAYVGLVEETGSLFAMSPSLYPLVTFGRSDQKYGGPLIDAGASTRGDDDDEPTSVDEITKMRKKKESSGQQEGLECHERIMNDRRCLVGVRRLEEGDGHESRMKRLLDGPPDPVVGSPYVDADTNVVKNNESKATGAIPQATDLPLTLDPPSRISSSRLWEAIGITLVLGMISFWFLAKRSSITQPETPAVTVDPVASVQEPESIPIAETPPVISPESIPALSEPSSVGKAELPPTAIPSVPQNLPPVNDGEETDKEEAEAEGGEAGATPAKKRARRGKRGAKKPKNVAVNGDEAKPSAQNGGSGKVNGKANVKVGGKEKEIEILESETPSPPSSLIVASTPKPNVTSSPSLVVSDSILGYGSHGTVVFQGSLQGRAVAVKRLLQDFVTLASREVSILQESDDHPNVIRYYYQEAHAGFLYIALELCPASLADIIETPDRDQWRDIAVSFDPKKALKQITSGLKHLHALKLIHRDIKPQNILVSGAKPGSSGKGNYRMLISDFGLCKKLDVDQTSFLPTAHGAMAAGTVGWRAPEILRGEVKLDDLSDDQSMSSRGSAATINGNSSLSSTGSSGGERRGMRLTKSVDIFALGCLYYYTLTSGGHPFGDRYEREVNIMKNAKNLEMLERFGEEGTEAAHLISNMLDPSPPERPDTTSCLLHPFFWDPARRLNFLQDASDRFEIMCRDPKDPHLLHLEKEAFSIVGNDWHSRLDRIFIENLGKFRKYDGKSVQDLLRALRNKKHHYQDLPDNVKRHLGPMPEGFLAYFTRRFPKLFLHVHKVMQDTGLKSESMFRGYFELPDP